MYNSGSNIIGLAGAKRESHPKPEDVCFVNAGEDRERATVSDKEGWAVNAIVGTIAVKDGQEHDIGDKNNKVDCHGPLPPTWKIPSSPAVPYTATTRKVFFLLLPCPLTGICPVPYLKVWNRRAGTDLWQKMWVVPQ